MYLFILGLLKGKKKKKTRPSCLFCEGVEWWVIFRETETELNRVESRDEEREPVSGANSEERSSA